MKLSWWEFCSTCWSINLQWGSIEDNFQCGGKVVISRENRPFEWEIDVGGELTQGNMCFSDNIPPKVMFTSATQIIQHPI